MADVEDRLVVRMEATLARFEKQMARARQAANTNATGIEERFDRLNSRMAQSSEKAARGLSNVVNISSRGRFVIQNTANQLGDMAVQLESGTAASRVMAQQLPQILGGFGALGGALGVIAPLLGTVAAIGIPVAAALYAVGQDGEEAGEKVKTFADRLSEAEAALGRAEDAMARASDGGVKDLWERYGEVTEAVRELAKELADIEMKGAKVKVSGIVDEVLGDDFEAQIERVFGSVGGAIAESTAESIAEQVRQIDQLAANISQRQQAGMFVSPSELDLLREMREELAAAQQDFANIGSLAGDIKIDPNLLLQINEAQTAVREALTAGDFLGVADALASIRDLLRQSGQELDEGVIKGLTIGEDEARAMANRLGDAAQAATDTKDAASGIGGALQSGIDAAADLARNFGIALSYAQEIERRAYERTVGRGRGADPRQFGGSADDIQEYDPGAQLAYQPGGTAGVPLPKPKGGTRPSRGGSKTAQTPQSVLDSAAREIEALQRRIDLIGKTGREVAELNAKYRLLDEAKRKGLDLDKQAAGTGETLRQQIDRQAEAIGALTEKYDRAQERADFFEQAQQDLKDGFIDAIVEGENLSGVLENVAKAFARAALQAALFNEGPFSSGGGGGGILGSIFGAVFGKRASGGPVAAGRPYLVNENTPNSEVFVPAQNGGILNVSQAQAALRGAVAGGGGGSSVVRVELSPDLVGAILAEARGQSVQITHRAVGAQQSSLMGRVQSMEERGTTR